ncbi:MAG: hypothetical protein EXR79_17110 [Myxococcales bacterium]|nr:hypothetical protein [Myxococcales bacterium]
MMLPHGTQRLRQLLSGQCYPELNIAAARAFASYAKITPAVAATETIDSFEVAEIAVGKLAGAGASTTEMKAKSLLFTPSPTWFGDASVGGFLWVELKGKHMKGEFWDENGKFRVVRVKVTLKKATGKVKSKRLWRKVKGKALRVKGPLRH